MNGKAYIIGTGPGDEELLTVKAVRAIENSDVVVAPSAMEGGESIALETAKEYIKEGTEVVIKHFPMGKKNRIEKAKEAYDFIEEKLKDNKVIISIEDQGIGISEEDLKYVFERFYRADKSRTRATGGTGIGLTIVKSIVSSHGGEVKLESKLGEGSKFTIILPKEDI